MLFGFALGAGEIIVIVLIVLLLLGGAVLCALGVLGAYLARVYTEVKNRPDYIIRETNLPPDRGA